MKLINRIQSLLFFSFLLPITLLGQLTITGKTIDHQEQSISFVNVLLLDHADSSLLKGTVTNMNGTFQLEISETIISNKEQVLLHISMIGYEAVYQNIIISSGKKITIPTITLIESASILNSIEIIAKEPLYVQKIDRMVVNIQNSITSAGGNALEILSKSPNIQVDRVNNIISVMGKQGVVVLINGKRNRMDLQALMQLLESIPADNIEKIEIITTPPANFDAEGNAGIINIILVKNVEDGFNGNFGGNFGYGLRPKMGVYTNFNIRKGQLNVYGDFSYNHELIQARSYIGNTIKYENEITETVGFSDRPAAQTFHNARFGLDYQLSDKTILGLLSSGFSTLWQLDAYTDITTSSNAKPDFHERLRSIEKNHWLHGMTNFSILHQLNESVKIDVNYDYLYYFANHPTDYFQDNFNQNHELVDSENFRSRKSTPIPIHVFKVDYSKKVNDKFSYEMGIKGSRSNFTNDISVAFQEENDWVLDADYTNVFKLDERIGATYLSSSYQLNEKTAVKAGLRYEYFMAHLSTSQNDNLVNRKKGNLFPSLFLSHAINPQNTLQLAYSRRVNRPNFDQLAPALFFFGPNTILTGNPSIQQTLTDNIKLDYRHKAYSFSLQYNYEDAPIAFRQPLVRAEKNELVMQSTNMKSSQMLVGSVSLPFEWTKWWNSRINANGYWVSQNPLVNHEVIQRNNLTYSFLTIQTFDLPKKYHVEIVGQYTSKFQLGIADIPVRWTLNLGIQKSFKDFKIAFNWNDIFNTGSFWDMRINQPQLNHVSYFRYELEGSIMRLSCSYHFGKKNLKSARHRQTGSEEERRRL